MTADQVNPPSWLTLIRTGLLPGVIDRHRPPIDTGSRFSVAVGEPKTNSTSATMLGNVYIFDSWIGVALFAVLLAVVVNVLLRTRNPFAVGFALYVVMSAVAFGASYPDVVPKVLQAGVSMAAAFVLVSLVRWRSRRSVAASGAE